MIDCLQAWFAKYLPPATHFLHAHTVAVLRNAMTPHTFACRANASLCFVEKDGLWTVRVATQGTRSVAVFLQDEVMKFMSANGIVGVDAKVYVRDAQEETVKALIGAGLKVYSSTLGPGDLLVLPPNCLILEEVGSSDVLGLRFGCVVSADTEGCKFFKDIAAAPATPACHISKAVVRLLA